MKRQRAEEPEVWRVFQRRGTIQVLLFLSEHPRAKPVEISQAHPAIARQVLGERLNELRELGLVGRKVHEGPPLGTTYELTPIGEELAEAAITLRRVAGLLAT